MAGDGISRINTEELLRAVGEITSVKKSIGANADAVYAYFRKLQDCYAGESAEDIYAVAGQLKKSSGAIITMLGNYEKVLLNNKNDIEISGDEITLQGYQAVVIRM